jgi:uncharacterized protein (TIGR03000 family)
MSRRVVVFLLAGMAGALTPIPALAGHGGGGGYGGHGGGYHGGYDHGGYGHGGYYHGGYYRGGYGYGFGFGLGIGIYAPYGYGWYGYGNYLPYGVDVVPATPAVVTVPGNNAVPSAEEGQRPAPDNRARLLLIVPANAEVEIAGRKMDQASGAEREFVSPPLSPGKRFSYSVRVRYTADNGKVVDETRKIFIRANDWWRVDFTRPAPAPRSEKLPAPKSDQQ